MTFWRPFAKSSENGGKEKGGGQETVFGDWAKRTPGATKEK